jgi:Ca2+-binding EF-hand superfamily protein
MNKNIKLLILAIFINTMPVFAGGDDRDMGPVTSFDSRESVTEQTVISEESGKAFANTYYLNNLKKSFTGGFFDKDTASKHFIDNFDLNKDSKVTKIEAVKYSNDRFSELNKDESGDITKDDLSSSFETELASDLTDRFSRLDRNNDGLISSSEEFNITNALISNESDINNDGRASIAEYITFSVKTATQDAIKEIDVNNDQKISKEELSAKTIEVMNKIDIDNNRVIDSSD